MEKNTKESSEKYNRSIEDYKKEELITNWLESNEVYIVSPTVKRDNYYKALFDNLNDERRAELEDSRRIRAPKLLQLRRQNLHF